MVFEFVFEELIRKHLDDYVENFDLNIDPLRGTLTLKNIDLKENALDAFDLPVKIKTGHIKEITLLIQWTNLYTKPLVVKVDGVSIVAVPNVAKRYNEEEEEKTKQEYKKKKIQRIEDAIKRDAENDQQTPQEKKKKPWLDSFAEKVAAHIIKHLELKLVNVHVRYEDRYTNPKRPFSCGLKLNELLFKRTNKKWKECEMQESAKQIFKLMKLASLAVYWNVDEKDHGYKYVMNPMSAEGKLILDTEPEVNKFKTPKIDLTVTIDDISVVISKPQFNGVLEMIESFERVKLLSKHKKWRPDVPLTKHAKLWWHYARDSILHDIHRRRKLWSWSYIETYRAYMKKYKIAYVEKISAKKITADLQEKIDEYERELSVFSIIVMRQLAEAEVPAQKVTQKKEIVLFGRKKPSNKMIEDIKTKFKEKYTAEEQAKLYNAIGYKENQSDIILPKNFVADKFQLAFTKMTLTFKDNELIDPDIITFQLEDVTIFLLHRPAGNAIKVDAEVKKYTVKGTSQNGENPVMALSQTKDKLPLLNAGIETNPLDGDCNTRVKLETRPIEFKYDAVTMNKLVEFVKPPQNVDLQQLSHTAVATFEAIKEYSASGLRHAIDKAKFTEILVHIKPSVVIIPHNGYYTNDCKALVLDLGNLEVRTEKRQSKFTKPHQVNEDLKKNAYDRYNMKLDQLQILFSGSGKGWRESRKASQSHMHIIEPIKIDIVLQKCMLDKDLALPLLKVSGKLPLLSINISDQMLHNLVDLANSIPLPESTPISKKEILLVMSSKNKTMTDAAILASAKSMKSEHSQFRNYTKMEIKFEIKQIDVNICQVDNGENIQMVTLEITSLGTKAAIHTHDIDVMACIGDLKLQHKQTTEMEHIVVDLVNTSCEQHCKDGSNKILQLRFIKTKKDGPYFAKEYGRLEQKIEMHVGSIQLLLQQEALFNVLDLAETLKLASTNQTETVTFTTKERKIRKKTDEIVVRKKSAKQTCRRKIQFQIESLSAALYEGQTDLILNEGKIIFESGKPFGKAAEISIETSNLIFNTSPDSIKTISGICTELALKYKKTSTKETGTYTAPADLWKTRKLSDSDFWFLKLSDYSEKEQGEIIHELAREEVRLEQCIVTIPFIVIQMKGGVGQRTIPLILVESSMSANINNWSSKLSVEGTLKLEVAYYNEKLSEWEPLLEPVVEDGKMKRWELGLEVKMNEDFLAPSEEDGDCLSKVSLPPKMTITAFSNMDLQLTLSKTCLEVLHNLYKAYDDAYMLVEPSYKAGEILSPFCIQNRTGLEVAITLNAAFDVPKDLHDFKVKMTPDDPLNVLKLWKQKKRENASLIKTAQEGDKKTFDFHIERFNATRKVTVKRAEKRLYKIKQTKLSGEILSVIVRTETPIGQKIVSIQSIVQITNHFQVPIEVYYVDDTVHFCGVVAVDADFSVPLMAVYTRRGEFQFKPEGDIYCRSDSVSWKDSKKFGTVHQLKCGQRQGGSTFNISVTIDVENVYLEDGDNLSAKSYIFHMSPTVILHNLLPYQIKVQLEGLADLTTLQKGENTVLLCASVGNSCVHVNIPLYKGQEWMGKRLISSSLPTQSIFIFEAKQCTPQCTLNLGLHCQKHDGCMEISIYSPYWMINKTGKDLNYKASDGDAIITHEHKHIDIVMFSFKERTLFSYTKKASLKMLNCYWSDEFSVDPVGRSFTVQCKINKEQTYTVGVKITLSSSGLTKICTFTPFYMLMNTSKFTILCTEINHRRDYRRDDWITVPSKECRPFWPVQSGKNLSMKAKFSGSDEETSQFLYNEPHTTLMKLSTQHGGLNVDCQVTESDNIVTFSEYMDGMATVLMVNHTEKEMIHFHEKAASSVLEMLLYPEFVTEHVLNPQQYLLYTWKKSTNKREIIWTCGKTTNQGNDLKQDGNGEFSTQGDQNIYWVSFLNGLQRILLFTDDGDLFKVVTEAGGSERIELKINICIQGLGVSLVNDSEQKEVAYLGVTSPGIVWVEKGEMSNTLNKDTGEILEKGYQQYVAKLEAGQTLTSRVNLGKKTEVDWNEMMMFKPKQISIRRRSQHGIFLQIKTSPHQIKLLCKIQRVQFDNQMNDAIFQTVLPPTPLEKSIVAERELEPFVQLRIMRRKSNHSNILQFKYCTLDIKKMTLNVDLRFIDELIELLPKCESYPRHHQTILLEKDYKTANAAFKIDTKLSIGNKHLFDHLIISPMNIHLCFSSQGCGGDGVQRLIGHLGYNILLQTVGVVLANLQDAFLTFDHFERKHTFYNLVEMKKELKEHYKSQALNQIGVFVRSADVLGNPHNIMRGDDNQHQLGPAHTTDGHASGGVAGSASQITGALGKFIAALTFDDDFQKKRRQSMNNKRQADLTERLARDGKGILKGVYHGVTGIVKRPVEGFKRDGVAGVFTGLGKGIVGVVTRPASGLIDFASGSFDSISRINEESVEINRQRKPRMFTIDKVIRPYNKQEAAGYMLLQETEKGKFASTDYYVAHAVISQNGRNVLIITDKRVMNAERGKILGLWNVEWSYTWSEIKDVPQRTQQGIEIPLKETESLFSFIKDPTKKDVHIFDAETADIIHRKIEQFMKRHK